MKPKPRRSGPKNTLVEDPQVAEIKKVLAGQGHTNISEAAKSVGFPAKVLTRIIREGISADPRQSTVDRLKKLGIYELVPRRDAS